MSCQKNNLLKKTRHFEVRTLKGGRQGPEGLRARHWCSKRQTSTSVSTAAEAELVATTSAVKESAIPAQVLLAVAFGKGVPLRMYEDNDACSSVVKSG
eukprot:3601302-Amphidinium_carterae.6